MGQARLYIFALLLLLLPPASQGQNLARHSNNKKAASSVANARPTSASAAMRKFIAALKHRDAAGFLALFSRKRPFYANNPMNVIRVAVPFRRLAADVRNRRGFYWDYMERGEGGMYDAFVDNIGDGKMWKRVGKARFVPPGADSSSRTFVEWRREGGRWVIHEISYPQS